MKLAMDGIECSVRELQLKILGEAKPEGTIPSPLG